MKAERYQSIRPPIPNTTAGRTNPVDQPDLVAIESPDLTGRAERQRVDDAVLAVPPAHYFPSCTNPALRVCSHYVSRALTAGSWSTLSNGATGFVDGLTLGTSWAARKLLNMRNADTRSRAYRVGVSAGAGIVTTAAMIGIAIHQSTDTGLSKEDFAKLAEALEQSLNNLPNLQPPLPLNMTTLAENVAGMAQATVNGSNTLR